jgi:pantothenate kinase
MRMSYPLFPLVLFWALALFQTPARARAAVWLSVFLVVQTATNFVGVALDPATGKITVSDLWQAVQRRFQSR